MLSTVNNIMMHMCTVYKIPTMINYAALSMSCNAAQGLSVQIMMYVCNISKVIVALHLHQSLLSYVMNNP